MQTIIEKVEEWAEDKGLFTAGVSSPKIQFLKTVEEVGELSKALNHNNMMEIVDGIGDVAVTLIILSRQAGFDFEYCIEQAYKEIEHRKGQTVNGTFIKN